MYDSFSAGVSVFISALLMAVAALRASQHLHHGILTNCLRSPMLFYDTTPMGRVVNRFSKDVDVIDTIIPRNVDHWARCIVHVTSTLIVISVATPLVLAVILPISVFYFIVQVILLVKLIIKNLNHFIV